MLVGTITMSDTGEMRALRWVNGDDQSNLSQVSLTAIREVINSSSTYEYHL